MTTETTRTYTDHPAETHTLKYAALVEYDGTDFNGTQIQPNGRTVQEEIEKALRILLKTETRVCFSGRTDTGVSALGQVFHFYTDKELDLRKFLYSLNAILPGDIAIRACQQVPKDFCSRRSARKRWYRFTLYNHPYKTALHRQALHVTQPLDETLIHRALQSIVGTHDFSSFRAANSDTPSSLCTVYKAACTRDGNLIYIDIVANRYLYNMIRILVGTVLKVALEDKPVHFLGQVLQAQDRTQAGKTVKPQGLSLMAIEYPEHFRVFAGETHPTINDILKENLTEAVFHEDIYRKAS